MHAFPNLFMYLMVSIDKELVSGSAFRHPARESGLDKATPPDHILESKKHISHAGSKC
jgi:hypothetical protein